VRTATPLGFILLLACSSSLQSDTEQQGVRLAVAPASVAAGGNVALTLTNGSAEAIGYNLCTSTLERREGGDWRPVPSDRVCTMELRTLEPGRQDTFQLELPAGITAGEYRFRTGVELPAPGARRDVVSEPFRVSG
jgi:hypothetical protein